ncbi:MAG: glycosyltransferase family 39 protein [Candidatus Riflebacteria bacterium]|nr:glycosyltransferase family 39 protein [Candidatus Riflebacteria bacterium]
MNNTLNMIRRQPVLAALLVIAPLTVISGVMVPAKAKLAEWFHASGFILIFAAFIFWLTALPWALLERDRLIVLARRHLAAAVIAILFTVGAFLTSPPEFRILADETNLMGTATSMYDEHSFYNPTQRTHFYEGMKTTLSKEWDKRPLFFPFMIYLAHSFLGYRDTNAFAVNAICSFFMLFTFYLLLNRFFTRFISIIGMAILAAFPLLVLWMTSGGFEVPNLLFGVISFLFLERLSRTGSAKDAEALVFTLILLAQIRYESALFMIVLVPVGAVFLKHDELQKLSWKLILVPVLLLPIIWQRITNFSQGTFQVPGGKASFSLEWLGPNLTYAWRFFNADRVAYGMIPIVFWGAVLGLIAAIWWYVTHRNEWTARAWLIPGTAVAVFAINAAILFTYYWGNLTLQYAMRLGLIFVPFMVASLVFLLDRLSNGGNRLRVWLAIGACALPIWYWSGAGQNEAVREILIYREFIAVRSFLNPWYPRKDILIISDLSNLYVPFRWSAVNVQYANNNYNSLKSNLDNALFQDLIAIQRIKYSDGQSSPETLMDSKFELETLYETQYSADEMLRISRVKHSSDFPQKGAPLVHSDK